MAIIVVPTKKCDLRCRHCMRSTFVSDYMDLGMFSRFVEDVESLKTPNLLWTFTGGEPTVHPQIGEMFKILGDRGIRAHMVTNGQRPEGYEQVIQNKHGVRSVCISFDSPIEELNDKTRGKGAYKKAIAAVKAYQKSGSIIVTLGFVVHDENVHTVKQCLDFAKELRVSSVSIWSFQQWVSNVSSDGSKYKSLRTTDDLGWSAEAREEYNRQRQHIASELMNNYKPMVVILGDKFEKDDTRMSWPTGHYCLNNPEKAPTIERLVLLPDGKVSLCCDLYDVDYNYTKYESVFEEEPLSDIMGDYSTQPLSEILAYKENHFKILRKRRQRDAKLGLLKNGRENACTNCAYYHYQPPPSKVKPKVLIPIKAV